MWTIAEQAAAVAATEPGLFTFASIAAFMTLTALEIVLGVDNVIFIALVADKLPPDQAIKARRIGLILAAVMRVGLLLSLTYVMTLDTHKWPLFGREFSVKDMILIAGGLFLVGKSVLEIHHEMDHRDGKDKQVKGPASMKAVVGQILVIDLVFSLDSIITAIGMAQRQEVMIAAVLVALAVMLAFSGAIARVIGRNPTLKMLALSFLILIGVLLIADGFGQHISKGYVYFAMAFSLGVELLNISVRKKRVPSAG
ncbi:MAG: TerC family protein [Phycisphaerales bacterium]